MWVDRVFCLLSDSLFLKSLSNSMTFAPAVEISLKLDVGDVVGEKVVG